MKKLIFIGWMLASFSVVSLSQENEEFELANFVESLFNSQSEDLNYEDLYEQLLLHYENPLDINSASFTELQGLFILTQEQILHLRAHITDFGPLLSIYELAYIEGFDMLTIEKLIPFVRIDPLAIGKDDRPLLQRITSPGRQYIIYRFERILEEKRGFSDPQNLGDTRYLGNPNKHYLRYRSTHRGDYSLGFTFEKDPGETFQWSPKKHQYGVDYLSAHLMLENKGKWHRFIIGDYQLQLGQGLLLGAGFGVGKGAATTTSAERVHYGIRPYTSVIEGGFLRGAAATYKWKDHWYFTGFLSHSRQDASLRADEETFESFFSSIQLTGFHRTPNEISNRKQITETVYGFNLHHQPDDLKQWGIIAFINRFSTDLRRPDLPHNRFEFQGSENINASMYGNYSWRKFRFFGELGISKSGGMGALGGFTTTLAPRLDFAMLWRNYARDFHALRGNAFAEGSRNINEQGVYWGFQYTLNNKFFVNAYFDSFRFPWLRFRVDRPSKGNDYLVRFNYLPSRKIHMYVQYRKRVKEENTNLEDLERTIVLPGIREQWLAQLDFSTNSKLSFKSRLQASQFTIDKVRTTGIALMQDVIYQQKKITISGRLAIFDTEGAQNRQYAYERDVLFAFSIPAYGGRGIRNYLLLQYKWSRNIDFWARFAQTTFFDRNQIGTGLETIEGNQRTDIKFQVRYRL